ncbi:MAG: sugar phosphate isomerase/epimerase [Planctomycetales bacterium]|nr:sugar phosphate isomerase/epimerase [Planctomycetales bacterium]
MQLGFVSAILPDQTLEDVFAIASEIGYDCVELMCWPVGKAERRYAGVTHVDVADFDKSKADAVNELADKYGVQISGLGYYPNALSPNAEESENAIAQIEKVISAAAVLGVGRMNTFVGRDWTRSIDENWDRFKDVWTPIIQRAGDQGVNVGIENCPMLFTNDEWPGGKNLAISPSVWRRMFETIPNMNFGLNFDPSHFVWMHMDYLKPLREFSDRIFHVHAKDVRVDQHLLDDVGILATPNEYHTPKLPGFGDVDWGRFFSILGDAGYTGPVCVEVEDRAFEGSDDARRLSLVQSHTYLRNFVPKQ